MRWLKQAITGADNRTLEPAYLALAFIMVLTGISIVCMLGLAFVDVLLNRKDFNPAGLGGGISALLGGLAAFLGGVGAYILMDRKQPSGPATTTTTEQSTTVKTVAALPAAVPAADLVAAGRGIEPLNPKIGADDVGKSVALVDEKKLKAKRRK